MSVNRKLCIKFATGRPTNNRSELEALWAFLKIVKDKQVLILHVYNDSKLLIDWEKGKSIIIEPHLQHKLNEIPSLRSSFELVSFSHIYRELNSEADMLSKLALAIQPRVIEVEEDNNEQITESFYNDLRCTGSVGYNDMEHTFKATKRLEVC